MDTLFVYFEIYLPTPRYHYKGILDNLINLDSCQNRQTHIHTDTKHWLHNPCPHTPPPPQEVRLIRQMNVFSPNYIWYSEASKSNHLCYRTTSIKWPIFHSPYYIKTIENHLCNLTTSLKWPLLTSPLGGPLGRFHCIL